eukprot:1385009-Rhodomonas_salina.3
MSKVQTIPSENSALACCTLRPLSFTPARNVVTCRYPPIRCVTPDSIRRDRIRGGTGIGCEDGG